MPVTEVYELHKHMCKPQGSSTPTLWFSQKLGSRSKNYALNNTSVQEGKLFNFHKVSLKGRKNYLIFINYLYF